MTDYRAMTALELRRTIAERCGWADVGMHTLLLEWYDSEGHQTGPVSEFSGIAPGLDGYRQTPDWPADANAELRLPPGLFFIIMANENGATCGIGHNLGEALIEIEVAKTIAEARALAWLAYSDARR